MGLLGACVLHGLLFWNFVGVAAEFWDQRTKLLRCVELANLNET